MIIKFKDHLSMQKEYIKEWNGKIIGSYETDNQGKITLKDFYGHILGRYDPKENKTRDFYGRIVGQGNALAMLLR